MLQFANMIQFEFGLHCANVIHIANVLFVLIEDLMILGDFLQNLLDVLVLLLPPFLKFCCLTIFFEIRKIVMNHFETFVNVHVSVLLKHFILQL